MAARERRRYHFEETDVRPMGRQARGVKAISLREGDCVVGMCVVTNDDLIPTASETGFGRISNVSDYRLQSLW